MLPKILLIAVGMLLLAGLLAVDFIPFRTDFIMLYAADLGLVNGVGFYEHTAQVENIESIFPTEAAGVTFPYFIYPPWLAYGTFFLGWLSPSHAAQVWFAINLAMVFYAVYLLTANWDFRKRVAAFLLVFLSLSTLGLLIVGQYAAPVLLGMTLLLTGYRRHSTVHVTAGLLLMTIKPHLGIGLWIVGVIWLLLERERWAYRSLLYTAGGLLTLMAISFLIDPGWVGSYFQSLSEFRAQATYNVCEQCSSLSILAVRLFQGAPYTSSALLVGVSVFIGMLIWPVRRWNKGITLQWLLFWMIAVTLISNPYLNNYDYVLLVFPFLFVMENFKGIWVYALLGIVFVLPWVAFATRNPLLVAYGSAIAAVILLTFSLLQPRRKFLSTHFSSVD